MRYVDVRYVKSLLTNIQKQQNKMKISLVFKKFTNCMGEKLKHFLDEESEIFRVLFYVNTNIYGDFQICISVPLTDIKNFVALSQINTV